VSTCYVPGSPTRPALWPWTSPVSARRSGGAAGSPAKRRPWATVDLVAARHGQPPRHRSRLARCRQASTRPWHRGTSIRCARPGGPHSQPLQVQRDADRAAALPRTAEACPSGHRTPGHRTRGHWTSDAWTLDVRSTGWTDIPRRDRTRRTGQRPAWPASGHPRSGDHPLGGPTSPGSQRWGARPPRTAPR
jgi:hypothetical protein